MASYPLAGPRRRARTLIGASLLLAAAGALGATAQDGGDQPAAAPKPPTVTVAKPVVRQIVEDDEFIGRFEPVDEVSVRARVGGYLDKVQFRDGAIVKQGDPLFTIDQRPFQLALTQAQADLVSAQTLTQFAESQFRRAETLAQGGNIPVSTLDDRRREFITSQASLRSAQAALDRAQLELEYTVMTAPISGRIDRKLVSIGNLIQADQTVLTTVVSLDPIDFYFDIDERNYIAYSRIAREGGSSIQEGAKGLAVSVKLADDREKPVSGKLDFAENRIDPETGTMRLRAQFPNSDLALQPGLFGRVNIPGSLPHPGVLVPDEAIGADQDRRILYIVEDDGAVSAKPVRTGPKLYGYRVIREGLQGDETIVVNGLSRVRVGQKVTPEMVKLPPEAASGGEDGADQPAGEPAPGAGKEAAPDGGNAAAAPSSEPDSAQTNEQAAQ